MTAEQRKLLVRWIESTRTDGYEREAIVAVLGERDDLLAACRDLLGHADAVQKKTAGWLRPPLEIAVLDRARAAIAAAEGRRGDA